MYTSEPEVEPLGIDVLCLSAVLFIPWLCNGLEGRIVSMCACVCACMRVCVRACV